MAKRIAVTDISGCDSTFPYYVYVYRDTREGKDNVPIYVGKGHNTKSRPNYSRAKSHWVYKVKNPILSSVFAKMEEDKKVPLLEIVKKFELEKDAFEYEYDLIKVYGRRDLGLGTLCNFTDGGEGTSGAIVTDELKERRGKKISETMATVEGRARFEAALKIKWEDAEFRERHQNGCLTRWATADSETRERHKTNLKKNRWPDGGGEEEIQSKKMKTYWATADLEKKESHRNSCINIWSGNDVGKKIQSEKMNTYWASAGAREKASQNMKESWARKKAKLQAA